MTDNDQYELAGADLSVARRAIAVALMMSVSSESLHEVRAFLPPHSEMVRVLQVIGWAGAPETDVSLVPQDRRVLLDVVYGMLILAFEETVRSADEALRATSAAVDVDASVLVVAESLAGLARRLQARGPVAPADAEPNLTPDATDTQVSPALRALADSVGLPVWITSADFVIEWINPAFERLLDADLQQVRGTPWHCWSDPHDTARVAQVLEAARLEHRNWSVEVGAGPIGGPYTRLLMLVAPRLSSDGLLVGWTGICFDVSRNPMLSIRLEAMTHSLTVDATRINLLLRQLPAMIWTTNVELRCTFSNGAGFLSVGAEPNQLVGRRVQEVVGTTDPAHPALRAHNAALGGETARYRDWFARRAFDVVVEPLRDGQGDIFGCIGLGIDVTEKVERELEYEQLLRQLRFGQRIGRMGSWEMDVGTGKCVWSDEAYRLLGLEPEVVEPSYATFLDRIHPDDRDRLHDRYVEGARTGETYEVEYRVVRRDGAVRQMRGVVAFEHDPDGSLVRIAGILQDVSPFAADRGSTARDVTARSIRDRPLTG